jgi:hypothetical protein
MSDEQFCKINIDNMLKNSQTKVIFPVITLGLLKYYHQQGKKTFTDGEIRRAYEETVKDLISYLGHDLHIGGKYYDAYPSRNLPRYAVLRTIGKNQYELLSPYTDYAEDLISWIPGAIKSHVMGKLGIIPQLKDKDFRSRISINSDEFVAIIESNINKNSTNFEVFSFAVIKIHLEKFACKIYRDTRTSAHDKGVDISTNFGVVYQIKKLKIYNMREAKDIYKELESNFDGERINDGNIILVIDDISSEVKKYLIDMKIQSINKSYILKLAEQFEDMEDREKVLRIIYEEFRREYSSTITFR